MNAAAVSGADGDEAETENFLFTASADTTCKQWELRCVSLCRHSVSERETGGVSDPVKISASDRE